MSTGTGALQTTYPGQKRADKRTFNRRMLLTKKDRNRPMKMTDFARVFQPIPLRLNYGLISTIQYLQRLFIHKKITPAHLACLCLGSPGDKIGLRIVTQSSQCKEYTLLHVYSNYLLVCHCLVSYLVYVISLGRGFWMNLRCIIKGYHRLCEVLSGMNVT